MSGEVNHLKGFAGRAIYSLKSNGFKQTLSYAMDALRRSDFCKRFNLFDEKKIRQKQYELWIQRFDRYDENDVKEMIRSIQTFQKDSLITIVIKVNSQTSSHLLQFLESLSSQTYDKWELVIIPDCNVCIDEIVRKSCIDKNNILIVGGDYQSSTDNGDTLSKINGNYVLFTNCDGTLAPYALYSVAYTIEYSDKDIDMIFCDEDCIKEGKRCDPYFKFGWDRRLFFQKDYVSNFCVVKKMILNKASCKYDQDTYCNIINLLKHVNDQSVLHIPWVLYHNFTSESDNDVNQHDDIIKSSLCDYFGNGWTIRKNETTGYWRSYEKTLDDSLVSIIIPIKDKVELLKNLLTGIFNNTDYKNFEVIIVDNGSSKSETSEYLSKIQSENNIRVIRDDGDFNYSRLNNEAVKESNGKYLLLLNNDIKVIKSDWLTELVLVCQQSNVGAVGAKLLYSGGTIQHAGVMTGVDDIAAHCLCNKDTSYLGHHGQAVTERTVSAVTGACLMVKREIFDMVNGLDEDHLSVSYNDVDFCIKIRDAGYDVVYTPYCTMYHLESQSRRTIVDKRKLERDYDERHFMIHKYGSRLLNDPYYSPILSLTNTDEDLSDLPRVGRPWRDWVEFVCPFHRGDVLLGLQVAYTAVKQNGMKIRLHVSRSVFEWLSDFVLCSGLEIIPIDIGWPSAEQTGQYYHDAVEKVVQRSDSSGRVVLGRPIKNLECSGVDLIENMLYVLGLPIDTKLLSCPIKECSEPMIKEFGAELGNLQKVVLIHPNGGWALKSMTNEIVKDCVECIHECGFKAIQIGGKDDVTFNCTDVRLLKNLSLSEWNFLFKRVHAVICVDSWTSHFTSIVDADSIIMYGSTRYKDVGSVRHFNCVNKHIIVDTSCEMAPCNRYTCPKNKNNCCNGMQSNKELTKELLKE